MENISKSENKWDTKRISGELAWLQKHDISLEMCYKLDTRVSKLALICSFRFHSNAPLKREIKQVQPPDKLIGIKSYVDTAVCSQK